MMNLKVCLHTTFPSEETAIGLFGQHWKPTTVVDWGRDGSQRDQRCLEWSELMVYQRGKVIGLSRWCIILDSTYMYIVYICIYIYTYLCMYIPYALYVCRIVFQGLQNWWYMNIVFACCREICSGHASSDTWYVWKVSSPKKLLVCSNWTPIGSSTFLEALQYIAFLDFQLAEVDRQVPSNPAYVLKWLEHCWYCALKRVNWRCLPERCSWNVALSLWNKEDVDWSLRSRNHIASQHT